MADDSASDAVVENADVRALHRMLGFEETERVVLLQKRLTWRPKLFAHNMVVERYRYNADSHGTEER